MFFTGVNIPQSSIKIGYSDKIMTVGSCFADNIGRKLTEAFFQTWVNPFGALYNPFSVSQTLKNISEDDFLFTTDEVFEYQSLWHSFSHSGLFSGSTREKCVESINDSVISARAFLKETRFILITFGTAWVYEHTENGKVVANCHKLPANRFHRRRLSVVEIEEEFTSLFALLKGKYPDLEVIMTVSPIRHWKDGAHENNVSKAVLHLAVENLTEKLPFVHYFPAYEIQLDELRDYRFYASDMLHPSETAIDYIWQRFSEVYFTKDTLQTKKELEQLRVDLNHRPLHPESKEYTLFQEKIESKKKKLLQLYPFLDI